MKRIALLSISCLLATAPALHASSINPLLDGYTITVGGNAVSSAATTLDAVSGLWTLKGGAATYTFAEVNASPLLNALTITRTCVTLNLGGCSTDTVSVSKAGLLNNSLQASLLVGANFYASVQGSTPYIQFMSTAQAGVETATVGFDPNANASANSPVPEPTSLALLGTGMFAVLGAARRRFA